MADLREYATPDLEQSLANVDAHLRTNSNDQAAMRDARALADELHQRRQAGAVGTPITTQGAIAAGRDLPPPTADRFSKDYNPNVSVSDFVVNKVKSSLLGLLGVPAAGVEAIGRTPAGAAPSLLARQLRETLGIPEGQTVLRHLSEVAGVDPRMKPPNALTDFLTNAGIDVAQNLLIAGGGAANRAMSGVGSAFGRETLRDLGMGVISGVGSAVGRESLRDFGTGGEIAGSILGGGVLPALLQARVGMFVKAAKLAGKTPQQLIDEAKANPEALSYIQNSVMRDLTESMRDDPARYAKNYEEALALQKAIPGLNLSLGQAFRAPSITSKEQQLARGDPRSLNLAESRDEANRAAIETALRGQADEVSRPQIEGVMKGIAQRETEASPFPGAQWRQSAQVLREKSLAESKIASTQESARHLRDARAAGQRARDIAQRLSAEADAEGIGARALAIRGRSGFEENGTWVPGSGLKGAATEAAWNLKQATVATGRSENAIYDMTPIMDRARGMFQEPIWDDANVTAVHKRVAEFNPAPAGRDSLFVDIGEIAALREAVNKDIRAALRSSSQNARSQLRNLEILKTEIDTAIRQAPFPRTAQAYEEFVGFYREHFAPRFLRGPNLLPEKTTALGESRMPPEKVFTEYLKPGGALPMRRYLELYGETPEAMQLMRTAMLDRYTQEVIRRGGDAVIDPKSHQRFIDRYRAPLEVLRRGGFNFVDELTDASRASSSALDARATSMEAASAAKDAHNMRVLTSRLQRAQEKLALAPATREQASEVGSILSERGGLRTPEAFADDILKNPRRMELVLSRASKDEALTIANHVHQHIANRFTRDGNITSRELSMWLNDPAASESYRIALSRAYSPEIATRHIDTMRKITQALERIEYAPAPARGEAEQAIRLWRDQLSSKVGFSWAMLFNMGRAVATTRVGAAQAGFALGSQALQKQVSNLKNDFYKEILESPEGAQLLLRALDNPSPPASLVRRMAEKLPRFFAWATGADRAPKMLLMSAGQGARVASEADIAPQQQPEFMP